MPPGKKLVFDLRNNRSQDKKDLFTIKEGVEYKSAFISRCSKLKFSSSKLPVSRSHLKSTILSFRYIVELTTCLIFLTNGSLQGVRYIQVVKRAGLRGIRDLH